MFLDAFGAVGSFAAPPPRNEGREPLPDRSPGALDGTYIKVNVPKVDKSNYRTKKGELATNVLGVCSKYMKFVYVLLNWGFKPIQTNNSIMILPQVHLRKPCYDFYFL